MEHCSRTRKFPVFTFLFAVYFTGVAIGIDQVESVPSVCSAENPDCFFQRFETFKLPQVEPVKVGHIQKLNLTEGFEHEMITAAIHPPIFEISNFLSEEECDHIIRLAKNEGLATSQTVKEGIKQDMRSLGQNTKKHFEVWDQNRDGQIDINEMIHNMENLLDFSPDKPTLLKMYSALELDKDKDENMSFEEFKQRNTPEMAKFIQKIKGKQPHTKSRHSRQAWIKSVNGSLDGVITSIQERVHRLTKLPLEIIKASEYLQVVSYGPMGHYNCHLDSDFISKRQCCHHLGSELRNCRICRYATILYFLDNVEDGGETAFPVADNSTFDEEVWMRDTENVCNLAKNCHKANVVVKPEKGKAVLWYNHKVNNKTEWMGQLDHFSFHGGCDVRRGTKWIANNWISLSEDREKDILNWIELAQVEEEENSESTSSSSGNSSEEPLHQEL